jgi:hypothetical protein
MEKWDSRLTPHASVPRADPDTLMKSPTYWGTVTYRAAVMGSVASWLMGACVCVLPEELLRAAL